MTKIMVSEVQIAFKGNFQAEVNNLFQNMSVYVITCKSISNNNNQGTDFLSF